MIFAVAVADMRTGRVVPGKVFSDCAVHAVTTVAQHARMLSPSKAGEVRRAGEGWATVLAGAGVAFCVTQLTSG